MKNLDSDIIHIVIQNLAIACIGIFILATPCLVQFARCIALHLEIKREPISWLASSAQYLPGLTLELVLAHSLLRKRLRLLRI